MRDPNASDFCYYPFMQILLTSDGKYRPCSKHQDYITHEGRELSIHDGDGLQDAWTSDYMQNIRQHFLDNKQFEGCRECWRMQRMRLRSMRFDSYQYGTSEHQVAEPMRPTRIEINASNVCNLKCRICYPNASSKWIKEHAELYGSNEKVYRNLPLPNLEQVKQWTDSLEEVCFFGGEPLLSEENMELLDHFISSGNAGRMSLLFNTNGTVFNDAVTERLRHFKRVRMYFSVDDIGERFEYQRKGAKWDEVAENIGKAYRLSRSQQGKNIDFKICCTVSIFNIYYFPEFFEWFGKHYPGLKIFWNLLFDPWRLNVQILPKPVKVAITERLRNHVKSTFAMSEAETKTIEELVTFLNETVDKPFDEFFRYANRHDTFRQESFPLVFPEMYQLIASYQPEKLRWGTYGLEVIISKTLRESDSSNHVYHDLKSLLSNLGYGPQGSMDALVHLESCRNKLEQRPEITIAVFAALVGVQQQKAKEELIEANLRAISKFGPLDGSDLWNQKVSIVRVCSQYSDDLLNSITLSKKSIVSAQILELTPIEIVDIVEQEHHLFSSLAKDLIAEKCDWDNSLIFRRLTDALSVNGDDSIRWDFIEKWSVLFHGSPLLISFCCTILDLKSPESLSKAFLTELSKDRNTGSNGPQFEMNIRLIGEVLRSNAGDRALINFLQTGRERLRNSLMESRFEEVQSKIEYEYGVLVS